jgi:aconitate hydratase
MDVHAIYHRSEERVAKAREILRRPLTLTEKILFGHRRDFQRAPQRRKDTVGFRPDRVAMQDATAQMALLQFMHAGLDVVAVPTTVHCDHLIRAHQGARRDLLTALDENAEVYDFLSSVSARYGIGFWQPGAGIIHQVVLENYAFPGGMMVGTDSHTPNGGGLGMLAIGVGGADAVDVMVGEDFGLSWPGIIGVRLTGSLSGWASAKDVILKLMGILTVKGGTGHIVEFFGPGARTISATGKGTICNMGAEHGATTSVFPYDKAMRAYLLATGRGDVADLADAHGALLVPDPEVEANPAQFFDRVIDIDLATLEPWLVGPHSPDKARPLADIGAEAAKEGYDVRLRYGLIGSCTNSSYEDISRAAALAQQARDAGLRTKVPLLVTPGSNRIFETIQRDGLLQIFEDVGATVLANACGPCIGQWQRDDVADNEVNTIISSYNRNFRGRNDMNRETLSFLSSPEIATALTFAGRLDFDPTKDAIEKEGGGNFRFSPPQGEQLPRTGFSTTSRGFIKSPEDRRKVKVHVAPDSDRLQLLERFAPWDGKDFEDLLLLVKAQGKCTTDHISAAGPWLRFRGHLDKISDNLFLGAVNAFSGEAGRGKDQLRGETDGFAQVARHYKAAGRGWIAVGDENYGEGSSREHAAMEPRYLGGKAVLARSFARIHETNLKKQGMLALTFASAGDYDRIQEDDRVAIVGLAALAPGRPVTVRLTHKDGTVETFEVRHTLTAEQIEWFNAGSALNRIAAKQS